jgi:hypothetical protein
VLSWFLQIRESADIMPDAQTEEKAEQPQVAYQIPHPKKNDVFMEYEEDCRNFPELYLPCDESLFLKVWREHFPNIKLRKYLRFAKCSICTTNRELRTDPKASAECKAKCKAEMTKHWQWVMMERGGEIYRQKEAVRKPKEVISITQDATDFPAPANGYPSFSQSSKGEKEKRLKPHIMVNLSHGDGVFVYAALPHIAADPNFSIEALQRTLKNIEATRGELPGHLNVQLDNSGRENKNTALFAYLGWLVERQVFNVVEVHFLPVGHTHNIADQISSRITTACKWKNIRCREELLSTLRFCYDPNPHVEFIDSVASIKQLFNPSGDAQWSGSRVRRLIGIQDKQAGVGEKTLHWQFSKSSKGDVLLKGKASTNASEFWSEPFRMFKDSPTQFDFAGVPDCTFKQLTEEALQQIEAGIMSCKNRLTPEQLKSCLADLTLMRECKPVPFHWKHGGRFLCELKEGHLPGDSSVCPPTSLSMPRPSCLESKHRSYKGDGNVVISNFVAYQINWSGPEDKRQDFWVGKVLSIDEGTETEEASLVVQHYCAPKQFGAYRLWRGKGEKTGTVRLVDVLISRASLLNDKTHTIHEQLREIIEEELRRRNGGRAGAAANNSRGGRGGRRGRGRGK